MKTLYWEHVLVTGGRDGRARSDDGHLDLPLSMPKAIGGDGAGSNPEQLFGAAYAACFTSSLRGVAAQHKIAPSLFSATRAEVALSVADDGRYLLDVRLELTVGEIDPVLLQTIIEEAKRVCAFANAVRGNIGTTIQIA